jgi:putative NADPH-quinone reductase
MTPHTRQLLLIQGHPDPGGRHFCHALAQAYVKAAADAGHGVEIIDVAKLDFPLLRSRKDQQQKPPDAIARAQSMLSEADHIVMIYPIWNGGAPALLKGFLEQTFRPTFSFPEAKAGDPLGFFAYYSQIKSMKGKTARVIVTMQMPAFVYRWFFRPHPDTNTLRVSGMSPVVETLIGLVESPDARKRDRWLRKMGELGHAGR